MNIEHAFRPDSEQQDIPAAALEHIEKPTADIETYPDDRMETTGVLHETLRDFDHLSREEKVAIMENDRFADSQLFISLRRDFEKSYNDTALSREIISILGYLKSIPEDIHPDISKRAAQTLSELNLFSLKNFPSAVLLREATQSSDWWEHQRNSREQLHRRYEHGELRGSLDTPSDQPNILQNTYAKISPDFGGIFDIDGKLISLFPLPAQTSASKGGPNDTSTQPTTTLRTALDQEGFQKAAAISPAYQEAEFRSFTSMVDLETRAIIEDAIGTSLDAFPLREQMQFLSVFMHSSPLPKTLLGRPRDNFYLKLLRSAVDEEDKHNRLKIFCIREVDKDFPYNLNVLQEKVTSPEHKKTIFRKVTELVDLAEQSDAELAKMFSEDETVANTHGGKIELLKKAHAVIIEAADGIDPKNEDSVAEFLKRLDRYEKETAAFTALFKATRGKLSEIPGLDFRSTSPEHIPERDRNGMRSITEKNYSEDMADVLPIAQQGLEKGLADKNACFFVMKRKGDVVAFDRFDDNGDHYYFGSFNVDPAYRRSGIGDAMIAETVNVMANEKKVLAHAVPGTDICSTYIEKTGFIGTSIEEFGPKNTPLIGIERDDTSRHAYEYRGLSKEAIAERYEKEFATKNIHPDGNPFIVRFKTETQLKDFLSMSRTVLGKHAYRLTRYFPSDKTKSTWYAAFEPAPIPQEAAHALKEAA